jgi:hypothetical protein
LGCQIASSLFGQELQQNLLPLSGSAECLIHFVE